MYPNQYYNMMAMPPMNQQQHAGQVMPPPLPPYPSSLGPEINPAPPVQTLIGPVVPENTHQNEDMNIEEEEQQHVSNNDEKTADSIKSGSDDSRRDRLGRRDRGDRGDRSRRPRSRERYDRSNRDRSDRDRSDKNDRFDRRDRDRRERKSKWSDDKNEDLGGLSNKGQTPVLPQGQAGQVHMPNMMMPGVMMQYGNMNMMNQPSMDVPPLPNMPIPNMTNMAQMPNTINPNMQMPMNPMQQIMPGMNMIDQNMMMMNQPMMMPNQPLFFTNAVLLPPIPGVAMPARRDRPPGCKTIFIGGVHNGVTEDTIGEIFQQFGEVVDIKNHKQGVWHVRFGSQECVEQAFYLSGYRFKTHDQSENEATTLFIDYALNREDQSQAERSRRMRGPSPPRAEPFSPAALGAISDKIKADEHFADAAPTLATWLERGECNKKNAHTFYSLIQSSNNQVRRLFTEKMTLDEEYQTMKATIRDKFARIVRQFEQVAKILKAARHQRVSDHFSKQQRRNIDMWYKMTEEVENIKEEFNAMFDEDEMEKSGKNSIPFEKFEALRVQNENLTYELEGYKNEAHLAKDEAERKFEKFKAHFIAQQALENKQQIFPPLPPPSVSNMMVVPPLNKHQPPDEDKPLVPPSEAKLISILTAFLLAHPLGATLDYLVSYVRSMDPNVSQAIVTCILQKYSDVFSKKTSGIGASIEHRWAFVAFDKIKSEKS